MRKSFTQLFGFLLLNVMMLFSFGLYAQEAQSTVELKAPAVDVCYNASNSYSATVTTRDFILMKSFDLNLTYDKTEFGVTSVTPAAALGGTFTTIVDAVTGKINIRWSNTTAVTIGDNAYENLFTVVFNVLNFPNNIGDNLFDSPLNWDVVNCTFYYDANWNAGTNYQVETTNFFNGSLNVPVSYPDVQYTVTPASCNGGQANITVTSPVGAGLYYYFNGSTTSSTSPLASATAPSTNTVRVVNANGCSSHLVTIPVTAPEPLVINSVTTENAKCYGSNGEIQVDAVGGTGPYTYWVIPAGTNPGGADWNEYWYFQNQLYYTQTKTNPEYNKYKYSNFQILKPAGWYFVTVDGINGCNSLKDPNWWGGNLSFYANPAWQLVYIGQPSPITFNDPVVTNNQCYGATDGTITVDGNTISGGTATYTVSINNTTWSMFGSTGTKTFTGLAAGTYTVTVKDYNGCTSVKTATVTQPASMAFTLTYQDVACGGTVSPTGSITITGVTGGTAAYTFVVAPNGTAMPASGWVAAPGTIGSLAAGYYSIWVKDAGGCVKTFANQDGTGNKLPIQTPTALAVATSADNVVFKEVTCNGSTYTLTAQASGGVAPYSYMYNGGATTTSTSYAMGSVVTDTQVTVVARDASGCTITSVVTVNVPAPIMASLFNYGGGEGSAFYIPPTCPGGNDGRIQVLATGGTVPAYSYSTDNVIWYSNNVLAVPEGITSIYVKDGRGCTTSTTVTVNMLTASTLTATTTMIDCAGAKTGTISVTTTWQAGRTVKYYVASAAADVFTTGTAFTPASINAVGQTTPTTFVAGTYYIGAKDEYGCTSTVIMVQVKEKAALQMTAAVTNATCYGLFDGTITINTTGGNGQPWYAVVNNPAALSNPALTFLPIDTYSSTTTIGKQIVQAQRGTYYVALKDDCGNVLTAGPYFVLGYKAITFTGTVGKTNITCNNANDGTITVPWAGVKGGKPEFDGAGSYIFTLYKPVGGTVTNTTGAFTSLAGGTYTVTIKDASGCTSSSTLSNIVITNPAVVAISAVGVTHFTCKDSRDGRISVTASGGTPGYWLAVNAVTPGQAITADNANWIPFGTSTVTTKTYIATNPGVYYLYIKDANGCIGNTVSVTVLEPSVLVPTGTQTNVTCAGGADGAFQINVTGGWTPTQTYSFKRSGPTTGNTNTTGLFTGLAIGTYTVDVNITNVPSSTTMGVVTYNYATASPTTACSYRTSVTITEPVPYSYTASTTGVICYGESNGTLTVNVLSGSATSAGQYYVQLTTTAHPILTTGVSATYGWKLTSGTSKSVTFTGLPHAIYSVWISNVSTLDGCLLPTGVETPTDNVFKRVASWEVNEPALPLTASVTWNNDVKCNGGNDGKFTVTAVGGSGGYKYAAKLSQLPGHLLLSSELAASDWQDSPVFAAATYGTWIIWVKDANGCIVGGEGNGTPVDEWRVLVSQPGAVAFGAANTANVTCFGANDGKVTLTPTTSAGQPYTYLLTGTDYMGGTVTITGTSTSTTPVITGIPANKTLPLTSITTPRYKVKLTDKNGCSTEITLGFQVTQYPALSVSLVKADGAFVCPGDINGTIEAVPTGGSGTYAYRLWRDGAPYTAWVNLPSFLVQVGHTWAVQVSDKPADPATGCTATDSKVINEPVGVTATLSETTCYSDLNASVIVRATGEAGRTFLVRYRLNTVATFTAWMPFVTQTTIGGLMFSNVTPTENFYYFEVKDDKGCTINFTKSFVPVQHPVEVTIAQTDLNATATITGGISPYSYKIGSAASVTLPADGNTFQVVNLPAGQNTVTVTDAHGCFVSKAVNVLPLSVTAVPASGTNQMNSIPVVLTFNRDVVAGSVNSSTVSVSGTGTPTVAVTGSGKVYTATIMGADMATVTLALSNGIMDAAGNTLSATSFMYTIGDNSAPTVVVTVPTGTISTTSTVGIKFSENVSGVVVGTGVTVSGGTGVITGSGSTYTLTVTAPEKTLVTVTLTNAIKDVSANMNALVPPAAKTYTTGDFTAPGVISVVPATGTVLANAHPAVFEMVVTEPVVAGTGKLTIYKKTGDVVTKELDAATATITSVAGVNKVSVALPGSLDKNTEYYVIVPAGFVKDLAGNLIAATATKTTWTFTTGGFITPVIDFETSSFVVYPNPFVDYVNISNASELSKVIVTNIAGQKVKEVVNPTNRIQLNELRSGIYFISLYKSDNVIAKTVKAIKQ